jgi:membrane associated rhomboid family serine protease
MLYTATAEAGGCASERRNKRMGGLIPLKDASRRPTQVPITTILIIVVNVFVFVRELLNGDAFVTAWSVIPAQIVSGHHWITILTAMFMHASWSHIIGNMIFLWAFSPEIEDAMGRGRYLFFYLIGGLVAMLAQVLANPHSTVPNLGASGAIAAVMGAFIVTYPRDRIRSLLFIFIFFRVTFIPAALLIGFWFLTQLFNAGQVAQAQTGGVAYLAHIGGFVFGCATARLFERANRDGAVSRV